MCRLLAVKSKNIFQIKRYIEPFASIAKHSKEYQGHGWGCAYLKDNLWKIYKNIAPIWEDNHSSFDTTRLLIVHARSAFQNEGITVENNMPFYDGRFMFIFNGELRGVRIKERGRIGAEKIFNYIKRFNEESPFDSFKKGIRIIKKRTGFIKAMNIIMADKKNLFVHSSFNTEPDYFTMYKKITADTMIICSEKFKNEKEWTQIENQKSEVFK